MVNCLFHIFSLSSIAVKKEQWKTFIMSLIRGINKWVWAAAHETIHSQGTGASLPLLHLISRMNHEIIITVSC